MRRFTLVLAGAVLVGAATFANTPMLTSGTRTYQSESPSTNSEVYEIWEEEPDTFLRYHIRHSRETTCRIFSRVQDHIEGINTKIGGHKIMLRLRDLEYYARKNPDLAVAGGVAFLSTLVLKMRFKQRLKTAGVLGICLGVGAAWYLPESQPRLRARLEIGRHWLAQKEDTLHRTKQDFVKEVRVRADKLNKLLPWTNNDKSAPNLPPNEDAHEEHEVKILTSTLPNSTLPFPEETKEEDSSK
jgi:hypothetical protein